MTGISFILIRLRVASAKQGMGLYYMIPILLPFYPTEKTPDYQY
jgi:hypothetical protein